MFWTVLFWSGVEPRCDLNWIGVAWFEAEIWRAVDCGGLKPRDDGRCGGAVVRWSEAEMWYMTETSENQKRKEYERQRR